MSIKENKIGVYEERLKIAEEAEDELAERLVKMQEIKNLLQSENIDADHLLNTKNALLNSENPERMLEPFGEKGVCICPFWHSKIVVPAKDIERAEELIGSELFCINEKDYPYEERFSNYDELIECTKNTLKKRRKILLKPLVYILIVVAGGFLSFLLSEAYNSPDEALIFMCFIGLLVLCYPFITKKHDLQKLMANYIDELEPKILSGQGKKYRLINDENIPEKSEMGEIVRRMPGEILKQKNKIETEDGIEISDLEFWQRVSTSNGVVEVPVVGGIYIEMNKKFAINRNFYIADYYFGSILGAEKTVIDKENFKGTVIDYLYKNKYLEKFEDETGENIEENEYILSTDSRIKLMDLYYRYNGPIIFHIQKNQVSLFIASAKQVRHHDLTKKQSPEEVLENVLYDYDEITVMIEEYMKLLSNLEIMESIKDKV